MKEIPTACSPFCMAFPSDRIAKATKNVNVHFLFTVAIPVNHFREFGERFEATTLK